MSKSLNNFYTLNDVISKGYDPLAFRLLVLQSHYRSQAHFSWENLEAAQNLLKKIQAWADLKYQKTLVEPEHVSQLTLGEAGRGLRNRLSDDLDTPGAIAILASLIDITESHGLKAKDIGESLGYLDEIFGLQLSDRPDITPDQKTAIASREQARTASDWATSDKLRQVLEEQGIGVRDMSKGTIWFRL